MSHAKPGLRAVSVWLAMILLATCRSNDRGALRAESVDSVVRERVDAGLQREWRFQRLELRSFDEVGPIDFNCLGERTPKGSSAVAVFEDDLAPYARVTAKDAAIEWCKMLSAGSQASVANGRLYLSLTSLDRELALNVWRQRRGLQLQESYSCAGSRVGTDGGGDAAAPRGVYFFWGVPFQVLRHAIPLLCRDVVSPGGSVEGWHQAQNLVPTEIGTIQLQATREEREAACSYLVGIDAGVVCSTSETLPSRCRDGGPCDVPPED